MTDTALARHRVETSRHRTSYIEAGPANGPLMIFLHGWPELALLWRAQIEHFAALGWRCIAPDMRGYGESSVPAGTGAYAVREIVADMLELHDELGGAPAIWIGHDWGSPIVWSIAANHADRTRGVASLCVPYQPYGFALANLIPLIDRELYPIDAFPVGQWDYFLFYRENFERAALDFEADVAGTLAIMLRAGSDRALGHPAITADVRARGGWFGEAHRAPARPRDTAMLSQEDFDAFVAAYAKTGFRGADSWYMNDDANVAYAKEAPNAGTLTMPVLFIHAAWDAVCETMRSKLPEPMRAACADLTEATVEAGHFLMPENPIAVNAAIAEWVLSID